MNKRNALLIPLIIIILQPQAPDHRQTATANSPKKINGQVHANKYVLL